MPSAGRSFDSETLMLLRQTLDEAWDSLTPQQRARTTKSEMALQILQLALRGERDPVRLRRGCADERSFKETI
jgi:hypothetical protein